MRKPILSIALAGIFLASSLSMQAADAPAVKLATVDVVKVMASYWKKQDSESKIQEAAHAAQEYLQKEGAALDEIKKTLDDAVEQGRSSMLTEDAKKKAMSDAERIYQQFQEKGQQAEQFKENKERELAQRRATDNARFFADIREAVMEIAKARGATVVIDTSGRSNIGISTIIHADPGFDITADVVALVNKSMPADFKLQSPEAPPAPAAQ
ncbi:MAG: OmpH family outer membrane protein [Opitutaceae bacterium]|nr:OmpH family outer membrane protein [Opitutaceae bacterium]